MTDANQGFTAMEVVYLVSFFLGLGFAVLSGLLSDVFTGGAHITGDIDLTAGDGAHGLDAGGVHFPAVSPVTISTFVASFGGTGIILMKLKPEWGWYIHVPGSVVIALGVTSLVFLFFYKIFGNVTVSSAPREADLIGLEAEVTVSIPKDGAGKIRYIAGGRSFTGVAKTQDNSEIKQGEKVKIARIDGHICFVSRS
jgi:membrane protein implicated in regulation of membrane protease activity